MFIQFFALAVLGILIGIFTGICPGIHVNLVAATLLTVSPFLLTFLEPLSLAVFIISLAVTHSFLDTIPSIYLGAPENENALSVLPGQRMLLQGEGYQAVKITITGTYFGMIFAACLIPFFMFIANKVYPYLKPVMVYLLILIVAYMILKDKDKFWSFLLFLLSGTLGVIVFSVPMKEPLFPLLSGLFGVSGLMISFFENTKIPEQKFEEGIQIEKKDLSKAIFGSSLGVFLIQFFPGLGPAQGAVIASQVIKEMRDKTYLALVGAMGTMSVVFSLVTFYTLGKAKDGSIVAISKLAEIDFYGFLLLVGSMVFAGSVSVFLVLFFAKIFSKLISKVNYRLLVVSIIIFVFFMCILINGWLGTVVLITSAAIGLIAPLKGIARSNAMGCLILPVILYMLI
jgi:putative membrane protein